MSESDRRLAPRYNLKIPLRIQPIGEPKAAERAADSEDVSTRGIYFLSDLSFPVGTPLQIKLRMPPEVTGKTSREWNCTGRVVRTSAAGDSKAGIAVEIQDYEVYETPAPESESFSGKLRAKAIREAVNK